MDHVIRLSPLQPIQLHVDHHQPGTPRLEERQRVTALDLAVELAKDGLPQPTSDIVETARLFERYLKEG